MEKQRYPRVLGALSRADLSLKLQGSYFLIPNPCGAWLGWNIWKHMNLWMIYQPSLHLGPILLQLRYITWHLQHFFSLENMAKFRIWIPTFQLALSQDIFFHIIDNHFTHPPCHFFGCWWSTSFHPPWQSHKRRSVFAGKTRCCWR